MGNLGQALARYDGFSSRGFPIAALVDSAPDKIGKRVGGLVVHDVGELPSLVREFGLMVGIIATPVDAAQAAADRLVEAGVGSILNFAATVIHVPSGVPVRKVDLATELQILSYYQQRGVLDADRTA